VSRCRLGEAGEKPIIIGAQGRSYHLAREHKGEAMTVEKLTRIDPGWTDYHGFESPLLHEWAESGALGARLHGITFPKAALAPQQAGALARRLEGQAFDPQTTMTEHDEPLGRRLTDRAPERMPLTRSDESRQIERARTAIRDMGFAVEERRERRAA
jgi:hypothetical protein